MSARFMPSTHFAWLALNKRTTLSGDSDVNGVALARSLWAVSCAVSVRMVIL